MHKIIRRTNFLRHVLGGLFLLGTLALTPEPAKGEDFCAITVNIVDSKRVPVTSTQVELADPSGNVVLREMTNGPTAKICDFGFGPHTLRVGTNECLPVSISNLQVVLGKPLSLNVILNACAYRDMRTGCLLYFRTVDGGGKPIPNATFSPRLVLNVPPETDSYGRWQSLVGGTRDVTFAKAGYDPSTVHFQCREDEEIDVQVVMKKSAPPH